MKSSCWAIIAGIVYVIIGLVAGYIYSTTSVTDIATKNIIESIGIGATIIGVGIMMLIFGYELKKQKK